MSRARRLRQGPLAQARTQESVRGSGVQLEGQYRPGMVPGEGARGGGRRTHRARESPRLPNSGRRAGPAGGARLPGLGQPRRRGEAEGGRGRDPHPRPLPGKPGERSAGQRGTGARRVND